MNRNEFVRNVESCQKQVRRFLTALCCGDSTMADDIAQDSFVKAYLSCDNLTDDNKFMSWIYRIAYNTFISSRRVSLCNNISRRCSQYREQRYLRLGIQISGTVQSTGHAVGPAVLYAWI